MAIGCRLLLAVSGWLRVSVTSTTLTSTTLSVRRLLAIGFWLCANHLAPDSTAVQIHFLFSKYSAIWTALVAAPFLRLSDTTQIFRVLA